MKYLIMTLTLIATFTANANEWRRAGDAFFLTFNQLGFGAAYVKPHSVHGTTVGFIFKYPNCTFNELTYFGVITVNGTRINVDGECLNNEEASVFPKSLQAVKATNDIFKKATKVDVKMGNQLMVFSAIGFTESRRAIMSLTPAL